MYKLFIIITFLFSFASIQKCKNEVNSSGQLNFYIEKVKDSTYYNLVSNSPSPIELETKFKGKELPEIELKDIVLINSRDTIKGVLKFPNSLVNNINGKDILSKYISTKFFYGNSRIAKHDNNYLYALPYEVNKSYKVSQSFNGKNSHTSISSKYAIDFAMPIGTKVFASREGTVVYAINHFKKSGGKEYTKKANKIVIIHNDGTFAAYSHLMHNGTLVKKGDKIIKGQHIGYSGNTGNSSGPHLHFAVRLPRDICVPVYFEGYKNIVLKKGRRYKRIK